MNIDQKEKKTLEAKNSLNERKDKEAAALRENLKRRKQQQRAKETSQSAS